MIRFRAWVVVVVLGSVVGTGSLPAQTRGTVPSRLHGRVIDAEVGGPIEGADVALLAGVDDAGQQGPEPEVITRTETDASGAYALLDVAPGEYRLRVSRIGYRSVTIEVRLGRDSAPRVAVALQVAPIPLEPLEVSTRGAVEMRQPSGSRIALGRVPAETLRQERFLTSDARLVTQADLHESATLGEVDVFRALQRLPGISTRDDFSAELWTRGAAWGETIVYLDGMPLFNPLHGFGLLSGMSARSVETLVVHPGVRPVTFSEGGAAVLDLRTRSGLGPEGIEAGADVSLASGQVWGGGAWGGGTNGWAVTARRSYADLAATAIAGSDEDAQFPFDFTDVHGRLDLDLGSGVLLDASGFWEQDRLRGEIPDQIHRTAATWGNLAGRVALSLPLGRLRLRQTVGRTSYRANVREIVGEFDDQYSAPSADPAAHRVGYATIRSEITPSERGDTLWSAGVEVIRHSSVYDGPQAWPYSRDLPELGVARWDDALTRLSAWGHSRWHAGPAAVEAGLRVDVGSATRAGRAELSPMLSVRLPVAPAATVSAAVGRTVQYGQSPAGVGPRLAEHLESGRLWMLAGPNRRPLSVRIATFGGEVWLSDAWLLSATAYGRRSDDVLLPDPTPGPLIQRPPLVAGRVRAHGLDVSARRMLGAITGWVAYSYGNAQAEVLGLTVPAPTDRRHALDVTARVAMGRSWSLNLAHTWATGSPYTRVVDDDCDEGGCAAGVLLDRPFLRRGPTYSSLDAVLSWVHAFDGWSLGAFIQGRNLLGRDNAVTYSSTSRCDPVIHGSTGCPGGSTPTWVDSFTSGMIRLPLIGLTATF
ncbi:MAG TPA: TonB-dependent receptor [Longimicrobiales bacterium]|jgi:hypothetical protein